MLEKIARVVELADTRGLDPRDLFVQVQILSRAPLLEERMRKAACFRMPKVASLSLAFALGDRCVMLDHADEKVHGEIVRRFREENPEAFIFAFVRNPFDRLVSAYSWLLQRSSSNRVAGEWKRYLEPYKSFEEFVIKGVGGGNVMEQMHFRTQSSWIANEDGGLVVDWVGRYETMDRDLDELCGLMRWQAVRLEKNNGSARRDYGDYYTPETAAIVERVYAKDFKMGGYSGEVR